MELPVSVYLDEEEKPESPSRQPKSFSEMCNKNSELYNRIKCEMESCMTKKRTRK